MSQQGRVQVIDSLRGFAILIVILTHTLSFYRLQSKPLFMLWDLIHFAVPMFVFCSAFIFFERYTSAQKLSPVQYFIARLRRLLVPYYIFLIVFFAIQGYFQKSPPSVKQVIENTILINGVDINWLILLFIQLTIVMILIVYLQSQKILFKILAFLSVGASFIFLFYRPGFGAKELHWISWSAVIFFTYFFARSNARASLMRKTVFAAGAVVALLLFVQPVLRFPTGLFANKYPPSIFYLSYGALWLSLSFLVFQRKPFKNSFIENALLFLSRNSYKLYFIHYIILYIVSSSITVTIVPWYGLFLFVLTVSVLTAGAISMLDSSLFKTAPKA